MFEKNEISIREATLSDLIALQKISRETFFESFAPYNTEDNMNQYLRDSLSLEKLSQEINTEGSQFYFVEMENEVIGYMKLNMSNAQNELKKDEGLEIERIYLKGIHQGKQIGQMLIDKAFEIARKSNASYVWLGVWEENKGAIKFYERNGFVAFDRHPFMLGGDEQTDIMMKKFLVN